MPSASVLMSVRNGGAYLRQAVDSILGQTFEDFEFIIIDNHSTDHTSELLRSVPDPRIVLTRPASPESIAGALNHGSRLVTTDLIARMDADDIAHPRRLEVQMDFMRRQPDVGILGTQVRPINTAGEPISAEHFRKPETHADISWRLFFGCPLWHPTVIMRKSLLDSLGWYGSDTIAGREAYSGEDYDLWCRAIRTTRIHNLPDTLLDYRIHEQSLSSVADGRRNHCTNIVRIVEQHLKREFKVEAGPGLVAAMLGLPQGDGPDTFGRATPEDVRRIIPLMLDHAAAMGTSAASTRELRRQLAKLAETAIWGRGFNILRESLRLARVDTRTSLAVLSASFRRLI